MSAHVRTVSALAPARMISRVSEILGARFWRKHSSAAHAEIHVQTRTLATEIECVAWRRGPAWAVELSFNGRNERWLANAFIVGQLGGRATGVWQPVDNAFTAEILQSVGMSARALPKPDDGAIVREHQGMTVRVLQGEGLAAVAQGYPKRVSLVPFLPSHCCVQITQVHGISHTAVIGEQVAWVEVEGGGATIEIAPLALSLGHDSIRDAFRVGAKIGLCLLAQEIHASGDDFNEIDAEGLWLQDIDAGHLPTALTAIQGTVLQIERCTNPWTKILYSVGTMQTPVGRVPIAVAADAGLNSLLGKNIRALGALVAAGRALPGV